eukprot:SM000724S21267  [mRNA]  locus=s724:753:1882:+ [translate_table: standard]
MVYASLNHLSTHPPNSPYSIYDEHTRAPAKKLDAATSVKHSIAPISDMRLTDVNDLLYGPESEYMQARMQIPCVQCVRQVNRSVGSREQGFAVVVRDVPAQATGGCVLAVEAAAGPSPLPVAATGVGAVFGGVPPVDNDATVLAPLAIDALVGWRQRIQAPVT